MRGNKMDIQRAIEEIIDRYISDCDFSDLKSEIKDAVLEEIKDESDLVEELENRVKDLEDKLEKVFEALKPV